MEKLEALWKLVIEYGTYVRINKLNGLDYWNMLKQFLKSNKTSFIWLPDAMSRFEEMKKMGIVDENNIEKQIPQNIWEAHHFYLQHARIPFKNKNGATFVRLFQIAYNAGQLNAEMNIKKNSIYTEEWKKYYSVNNLNSPQEYASERDLHIINSDIGQLLINDVDTLFESIKKQQTGGKYFKKYLRMKSKRERLERLIYGRF